MIGPQKSLKQPAFVALATMAVLLVGAVVFYKERILFGDAPYIAFTIINKNMFYIQELRYGSFITQMVPYFGQKLHLSIAQIMIGYAISFNLFYFIVTALLVYRYKQYELAILAALYYTLFVTESYFWTNNEIHQAVAWMFLFFGTTISMAKRQVKMPFFLVTFSVLAFLTIFTHFVVIIPLIFLWVYFLVDKSVLLLPRKTLILLSCLLVTIIGIKLMLGAGLSYDGRALYGTMHFSIKDVLLTFVSPVAKMFAFRSITLYWVALIVLVLGLSMLLQHKKMKLFTWVSISIVGYFIVMGLAFGYFSDDFSLFHVESEWASMSILVATPFVYSFLPKIKPAHAVVLLSAVFIIRLGYISNAIPKFKWRTEFKEKVMMQMKKKGITKLALYEDPDISKKLMLDWAIAEETVLQSAMNGDNPQLSFRFFKRDDKEDLKGFENPDGFSFSYVWLAPPKLNSYYFRNDSTRRYTQMAYEDLFK